MEANKSNICDDILDDKEKYIKSIKLHQSTNIKEKKTYRENKSPH